MDISASPLSTETLGKPQDWFKHIVIVRSDVQREFFPTDDAYMSEVECIVRSEHVKRELEKLGVKTSILVANASLMENLNRVKPDLCINFVDSIRGSAPMSAGIPGIFDLLGIPYVGAGTLALSLNSNKYLTKSLLKTWHLPTPQYQLLRSVHQELDYDLRFPLIAKLNEEHGSVGISDHSVVTNEKELRDQVHFLMTAYKQPVLIEEYIEDARELTAVVLESQNTKVFLSERAYELAPGKFKAVTFETKWATDLGKTEPIEYIQYKDPEGKISAKIKDDARKAFEILKMDDIGRFDVMLDKYNNYYIIDCNANPSLGPESSIARTAAANNQDFLKVLSHILKRNMLDQKTKLDHA